MTKDNTVQEFIWVLCALIIAFGIYLGLRTATEKGRYQIASIDGVVIRIDTKTARAWQAVRSSDGGTFWNYIPEKEKGILPGSD